LIALLAGAKRMLVGRRNFLTHMPSWTDVLRVAPAIGRPRDPATIREQDGAAIIRSIGETLRSFALATLFVCSMANVASADDAFWAHLVDLTTRKGIPVNFKRAAQTLGLPNRNGEYPAYQIFYDESDGTAHHLTAYEDALKVAHLIVTNFDRGSNAYRLGYGYLVSPEGKPLAAMEGLKVANGHWVWAQTAVPAAIPLFEREVAYWKTKLAELERALDRSTSEAWEQKCENNICRWWNGREKTWAE